MKTFRKKLKKITSSRADYKKNQSQNNLSPMLPISANKKYNKASLKR